MAGFRSDAKNNYNLGHSACVNIYPEDGTCGPTDNGFAGDAAICKGNNLGDVFPRPFIGLLERNWSTTQ